MSEEHDPAIIDLPPLTREQELLIETGGKSIAELRVFLVDACKNQFKRVSEDPREILAGQMTTSAVIQLIINDMVGVGADPRIVCSLTELLKACDAVVSVCEEVERDTQETQEKAKV